MNKKRFILKTALLSAFTAAVYFPASLATTMLLYQRKDPDIEVYVQENLEQIIQEQEKTLGITYPTDRPTIYYTLPEEYKIVGMLGLYRGGEDSMYLPSGILTNPESDFSDFMATIATFNNTYNVKRSVDHELAHFYCDKVKELVFQNRSPHFYFTDEELVSQLLVNEGIAEYVENKMNGEDEKPFSFQDWPSNLSQFRNKEIYQGGYAIVKPIIDQHGEKGIQFLLFNPPTLYELFTPEKYQERMLTSIAQLPEKTEPLFLPFRIQ
ncbi:MAG: hypothetical protein Q7S55_02310 [Nanoarchaeota archaeon]|nr:hypothetical protein [Nanoarchaeota archaeon]